MENVNIATENTSIGFGQARRRAMHKADEMLTEPVIVAWKDDRCERFAPDLPGGSRERWHDYGQNIGGKLECTVEGDFHFIFTEAADFAEPDLSLTAIDEESGTRILCVNNACTEEDLRRIGRFAGGGIGGV